MHHPDLPSTLERLRRERGWSGRRLASELGVDHATVSRWKNASSQPGPESRARIADLAGLSGDSAPSGEEIRDLRLRAGLSQEAYAVRLGVTQPTLSRIEGDLLRPGPELTARLREAAGPHFAAESLIDASFAECERSYEAYWRACAVYDRPDAVAWATGLTRRLDALAQEDAEARRLLARLYGSRAYWNLARGRHRETERMALAAIRVGVETGFDLTSGYAFWAWTRAVLQKRRITGDDRATVRRLRTVAKRHLDPGLPYAELIEATVERLQGESESADERLDALSERVETCRETGQFGDSRSRWETVQSYRAMFRLATGRDRDVLHFCDSVRCENPIIGLIFDTYGLAARARLGETSVDEEERLGLRAEKVGHTFAFGTIVAHTARIAPLRTNECGALQR